MHNTAQNALLGIQSISMTSWSNLNFQSKIHKRVICTPKHWILTFSQGITETTLIWIVIHLLQSVGTANLFMWNALFIDEYFLTLKFFFLFETIEISFKMLHPNPNQSANIKICPKLPRDKLHQNFWWETWVIVMTTLMDRWNDNHLV